MFRFSERSSGSLEDVQAPKRFSGSQEIVEVLKMFRLSGRWKATWLMSSLPG
jgi:hypothetical protein